MAPPAERKRLLTGPRNPSKTVSTTTAQLAALLDSKPKKKPRLTAKPRPPASSTNANVPARPLANHNPTVVLEMRSLSDLPGFQKKPLPPRRSVVVPGTARQAGADTKRAPQRLATTSSDSRPATVQEKAGRSTSSPKALCLVHPTEAPIQPSNKPPAMLSTTTSLNLGGPRTKRRLETRREMTAMLHTKQQPLAMEPLKTAEQVPRTTAVDESAVNPESHEHSNKELSTKAPPPAAKKPSDNEKNNQRRIESVLQQVPRPEKPQDQQKKTKASAGNFVRLNLKNAGGACRGRRAKTFKTTTRPNHVERNPIASSVATTVVSSSSQTGIDPVDDYIDGVYTAKNKKQKSKRAIPLCSGHQQPCKLLTVKKSGDNKGRQFYCCSFPRSEQCNHFQWADDTLEAAQAALLKNSSHSGFIARQVAAYIDQIKQLTVPELRGLTKRQGLECKGKRAELLARLAIWVRDEIAKAGPDCPDAEARPEVTNEETRALDVDADTDETDSEDSDDSSLSSEELEVVGKSTTDLRCFNDGDSAAREDDEKESKLDPLVRSLRALFGFSSFRDGQEWAIRRCIERKRTLFVAPTGFGKSLVYSMSAASMEGVCIVVSPLLSLIQDQLQVLPPRLPAVTLSGSVSTSKLAMTVDDIIRGRVKIVFVSPERLTSPSFRRMFRARWNASTGSYERSFPEVSLLCVDEAHCLSQWAHNFRPSYLRLKSMIEMIQPSSVLAITATAGPQVVTDICQTLGIGASHSGVESDDAVRISDTDRDNIDVACAILSTQTERLTKLIALVSPCREVHTKEDGDFADGCLAIGSVIVYVWRQRDAEAVAENIQAAGVKGGVVVYHGGMSSSDRAKAQSKFMRGKARICVATVAFGLGINKSDVVGVIHMYLSASPEHYLQEIGRAGRDGRPAKAIALVLRDEALVRHSLAHSDLISRNQVMGLLRYLCTSAKRSLSLLPDDRCEAVSLNVALPLAQTCWEYDCKVETIETLASLLELQDDAAPILCVESVSYDSASIAPRKRSLQDMAATEPLARAVLACAVCVEAPAGEERAHERADDTRFQSGNKLVGHTHGSYSFSVAECANLLGPDAEPRHVFAALRRLQSKGDLELALEASEKGRALHLKLTRKGLDLLVGGTEEDDGSLVEIADKLMSQFTSTATASANKVLELNFILTQVAEVSAAGDRHDEDEEKSGSLLRFQALIRQYFETEGTGGLLASEADQLPDFEDVPSVHELCVMVRSVLDQLQNTQAARKELGGLQLGDSGMADYTALTITKFLHGIAPPRTPPSLLRHHTLFGRLQSVRFSALYQAIHRLV